MVLKFLAVTWCCDLLLVQQQSSMEHTSQVATKGQILKFGSYVSEGGHVMLWLLFCGCLPVGRESYRTLHGGGEWPRALSLPAVVCPLWNTKSKIESKGVGVFPKWSNNTVMFKLE